MVMSREKNGDRKINIIDKNGLTRGSNQIPISY